MAKKYDNEDSGGVDPLRPISDTNPVRDAAQARQRLEAEERERQRLERERQTGQGHRSASQQEHDRDDAAAERERLERERLAKGQPGWRAQPGHPLHGPHSEPRPMAHDPVAIHPVGAGDLGGFISHLADAAAALRSGDLSLALTHLFYLFDQARLALTTGPAVYEAAGGEAAIPGKPGSLDGSVLASMADQLDGCAEQCKARVKAAKDAGTVPGRALRTVPWEGVMPVTLSVFHRLFAARQAAPPVPLPGP